MSATLAVSTIPIPEAPLPPRVALIVRDELRRRGLERLLATARVEDADVLLIELAAGEALPPDAAAFEGPLLVLSDAATLAADRMLGGVLPRGATERQVVAAVAAVAAGLVVRGAGAAAEPHGFAPPEPPGRPLLTPREVEVLAAVGQGMSNKAIARRLGISAHTVKYYLESIFQKLDVRSRAEAVTRGLRLGVQVL
jgi:DNA-binding CsgD family transcriptional regulator